MVTVDTDGAKQFIQKKSFTKALKKAENAYSQVLAEKGIGNEWLGWRRILKSPDEALLDRIERIGSDIRDQADVFIICGIGGSYLGAKAVISALTPHFGNQSPEIIFTGHHLGGRYLENLLRYLDEKNPDGTSKSVYLNVISKSGSTLETALSFKVLRSWMDKNYGDQASRRIIATTGSTGGVLNQMAENFGYEKFEIPKDVGGRFSVLTPVGLLPISVAGIDIKKLFYGAVEKFRECEISADEILEYAALRHEFQEIDKVLDVIGSFEPELNSFTGWIQQLLGESEGKEGKGMFPVSAAYSTDLHSIGQMIQQGQRNMVETFLVVQEPVSGIKVENSGDLKIGGVADVDQLGYLSGKQFHEINKNALDGTIEAHIEGGVPVFQIILEKLDSQNLGELIYFYELFTAIYVYMLEVNPFNQPGVEDYKKAMYRKLGKE
ncbi:MAG: glucose-6-phosphate isomerase [Balneolaceae bacterium]